MRKIKKSVYLVLIMLLGVIGLTTYAVTAWLTDTDTSGPHTFTVGKVEYTWAGAALDTTTTPAVPGQELVATDFTLTNASTVESELRFSLAITTNYPADATDALSLVDVTLGANWVYNETDHYYYYVVSTDPIIAAGTQSIDVLTSAIIDGALVGNVYATKTFTITMIFQAKQADYVAWADLGSISFSTGI